MKDSSYTVYDGRKILAEYFQNDEKKPEYQTAAEVEELRTWDYKVSA